MDYIIDAKNLRKEFSVGKNIVEVIHGISVGILPNDFLVIFGPSGSGKSTLLHMIMGLEPPDEGTVTCRGYNIFALSENQRADFRKVNIGFVLQQPNWIKAMRVIDNVAFPLMMLGVSRRQAHQTAREKLALFKLDDWARHYPTELSGGQQQRVQLARALITDPPIIIADEPTGNLDYDSGRYLVTLLRDLSDDGRAIVMVTHDLEHLGLAKRAVRLRDGVVEAFYNTPQLKKLCQEMQDHGIGAISTHQSKLTGRTKKTKSDSSQSQSTKKAAVNTDNTKHDEDKTAS